MAFFIFIKVWTYIKKKFKKKCGHIRLRTMYSAQPPTLINNINSIILINLSCIFKGSSWHVEHHKFYYWRQSLRNSDF